LKYQEEQFGGAQLECVETDPQKEDTKDKFSQVEYLFFAEVVCMNTNCQFLSCPTAVQSPESLIYAFILLGSMTWFAFKRTF
jgi:hypothetical protein